MFLKAIPVNSYIKFQRGSALIVAVFIIIVMTLLGTALVRILSSSSETVVYEVLGTRAYHAAHTGLQKKLTEIFPLAPATGVCGGSISYNLSTVQGLENCQASSVECTESEILGVTYYTITSIGQCEAGDVLTSRKLEVKARKL